VKFLNFSKSFTRSTVLKFWVKTHFKQRNSMSLILTKNLNLRLEPKVLNLLSKCLAKEPKKRRYHLIIMNFGKKKFTVRNIQKKELWCLNIITMEWGTEIFRVWCTTRKLQDPTITSLCSHTIFVKEMDSSNNAKNCKIRSGKHKEF
jgi:hypothetical protein